MPAGGRDARPAGSDPRRGANPPIAATEIRPGSPPALVAVLAAAAAIVLTVSYRLSESDFWQHLLVGKAIWQLHAIPHTQLWTWPTWGAPDVLPSWGFRALIWPVWTLGGVGGLFAWRWATALAAFGISWWTARRMGARGLAALPVLVLCALAYRQRSDIRPESLVMVLLAFQIATLESVRAGASLGRLAWLVPIALLWANVHISYHFGLAVLAIHLVDAALASRTPAAERTESRASLRALGLAALGAVAASFLNPFGWRALWQPFDFFLTLRHERIFETIVELRPIDWSLNWRNGLPLLMAGWPLLLLWRARHRGLDRVELATCALFTALALGAQRFLSFYAVAAAPYAARDSSEWIASRRWPAWSAAPWARAAVAAASCIALGLAEWIHEPPEIAIAMNRFPVAACDWIDAHGVRGRSFNHFHLGGYLLWRFWPEKDRLPFMDIHQAGTPDDRRRYAQVFVDRGSWLDLDRERRFDWALLDRVQDPGDQLVDFLDTDPTWALVFADDAAALFVRRTGRLAPLADSFAYRTVPAGRAGITRLGAACAADTLVRARARLELGRLVHSSPVHATALSLLANVDLLDGRLEAARTDLVEALRIDPWIGLGHQRLGLIALARGRPLEAIQAFERQRRVSANRAGLDLWEGQAFEQLGDQRRARAAYERELERDPGNAAARERLDELEGRVR